MRVVLGEAVEQLYAGLQHAIPAVAFRIVDLGFLLLAGHPFPVEHRRGILALEVGSHRLLEGSSEQHCRPGVLLLPAIEVAMLIAARARQILTDLGIAVGHDATSDSEPLPAASGDRSSQWAGRGKAVEVEERDAMHCDLADFDHSP